MRNLRFCVSARPLAALSLFAGLLGLGSSPARADAPAARAAQPAVASALPKNAQHYMRFSYPAAMAVPAPAVNTPLPIAVLKQSQVYGNGGGQLGIYQSQGDVDPNSNAFFQSLGTNGRSCFSCHRPSDGMSINTSTLRRLFSETRGTDPVFAPVDGANCPSAVAGNRAATGNRGAQPAAVPADAYTLLLNKGLFRVFLPVPKKAEFTVTVVSDPYGCNTNPTYATQVDPTTGDVQQMVSVYRRPRMSANLKYATVPALTTLGGGGLPNIDFVTGEPVVDPRTGLPIGGNLMWDGREPTLESQAVSATLGHAQALQAPTAAQVAEMVSFESGVYAAQVVDKVAGGLSSTPGGPSGGPQFMAEMPATFGLFTLYDGWSDADGSAGMPSATRGSIARGQALFNSRAIVVGNVAGFNNAAFLGVPNPLVTTCGSCHGNLQAGFDPFSAGQRDVGIGGHATAFGGPALSQDLPVFKLTCKVRSAGYYGGTVLTNDPGLALISGRCADIGRRSVPQLRGLASRAPFFSDGSAATVEDIVRFYDRRFSIGLTASEITDLANFLRAL